MVLLKPSLAGLFLLAFGVLTVAVIGQYVTMEVQEVQRRDLESHAEFRVGDVAERSYNLPGGASVVGTVHVTEVPSNQSGEIHFMVLDNENYQRWSTEGQADFVFSVDNRGQFNYTFKVDANGVYHFVFDNRAFQFKKKVVLTVAYDEVLKNRIPDPRAKTVGWALVVAGGLILIYGLGRKAPATWA